VERSSVSPSEPSRKESSPPTSPPPQGPQFRPDRANRKPLSEWTPEEWKAHEDVGDEVVKDVATALRSKGVHDWDE